MKTHDSVPNKPFICLLMICLCACSNSLRSTRINQAVNLGTLPSSTPSSTLDTSVISTVTISAPSGSSGSSSSSSNVTNISFDTKTVSISNHCNTSTSTSSTTSKPCVCRFSWNEINPNAGLGSSIPRTVTTRANLVQPSFLNCPAPDVYSAEIPNGTQIAITVLPGPGNIDTGLFNVPTYTYTKNTITVTGSFQDAQGRIFDNVLHYSCYEKFKRGMSIQNKIQSKNHSQTGESRNYILGTQFCVASANSSGASGDSASCPNTPSPEYSAQSYYYNLYIRNSEQGEFNQFNDGFICPMVKESLNSNNTIGTQNQPWPFDSTFAVSLTPSTTFSVGIVTNSKLSIGTSSTVQNTNCFVSSSSSSSTSSASSNGFITSCLGFAAAVNSDGSCPTFKDSSGQLRQTYRLRRYIAIYPTVFDTNGSPIQGKTQGLDTIYVLDRPVKSPSNTNPQKPYTMLGPKPCPFAFFDRKGVASIDLMTPAPTPSPGYYAINNFLWNGKNVDGIEFPNYDSLAGSSNYSCSTSFPHLSSDRSSFGITTVNINNVRGLRHVYVRPTAPFLPHYEEDTSFQACSPQASPLKDAPLHFSRDSYTGRVAWCTESYPTQNPNITSLDPPVTPSATPTAATGRISPYTSHTVKNTTSQDCFPTYLTFPATTPTATYSYPIDGYATHSSSIAWDTTKTAFPKNASQTCDRTVTTQGMAWTRFPLLAPAADIESDLTGINTDSSYMCLITYDNKGAKTGKMTPTDGCCDKSSVFVSTGNAGPSAAHLEPDIACKPPAY